MKKYTQIAAMLLMAVTQLTVSAYTYRVNPKVEPLQPANSKLFEKVVKVGENGETVAPGLSGKIEPVKRAATRADEKTVNLFCTLKGSTDGRYAPVAVIAIHEDAGADSDVNEADGSAILSIPAGTYDVIALFQHVEDNNDSYRSPGFALVIREDVDLSDDRSLELSADEATVQTQFSQELPDGRELLLPEVLEIDDEGNAVMNKDEDSYNVAMLFITSYLMNKDGSYLSFEGMATYRLWDGTSSERTCDILCNPVSEDWHFIQERTSMGTFDCPFSMVMATTTAKGSVDVKADDFFAIGSIPHAHTPLSEIRTGFWAVGKLVKTLVNGRQLGDTMKSDIGGPNFEFPNWYVYGPKSSSEDDLWVTPLLYSYIWDVREVVDNNMVEGCVCNPPLYFDNGAAKFAVNGGEVFDVDSNNEMVPFLTRPDNEATIFAPGHSLFSFGPEEMIAPFGDSFPFITTQNYDVSRLGMTPAPCVITDIWSVAQKGEMRFSDLVNMKIDYYFNGDKVLENVSPDRITSVYPSYVAQHPESGEWVMKMSADNHKIRLGENAELNCINNTELYFNTELSDNTPPTVRMMQMRNSDNRITERFQNAADGTLYVAAADYLFDFDMNTFTTWNEPFPAFVTVEYAPNGTDWFKPLEATEMPEMFSEYGLGHVYSVPLAAVNEESANGWFDLRVKVTDEAGNYQQQVISPAFMIAALSGTVLIGDDAREIYTEGNNIIAPENALVFTANGMPSQRTDLQPGVYIVRTPATVRKVIIR